MKILGFDISRSNKASAPTAKSVWDAPVSIAKVELPNSTPPALIPSIRSSALTYMNERSSGRGSFVPGEYELSQIGRIEDTDGYVRQAFSKKLSLMFKEGYDFVGPNKKTIKYIKTRLAQMSKASGIPTNELLRYVGSGLIKKSNAFLVKVRKSSASGGRRRTAENKQLEPVAGYFVLPPETMEVDADEFGRIRKWRQKMPSGDYKDFRPDDVIHFTFDRKEGFVFGTPVIVPVIDDIRALRKIEENIELLVYQHLFPLFHYIVGTEDNPASITESGEHEVDIVRREIQYMPSEGGIVTPERHEIRMIGAEGRALSAEGYIDHFKKRIFAGLGISAVDMGEGETANRATADNMSQALVDSVKDFQSIIETQFGQFVIQELLLESTFGDEVLNEENLVRLKFFEIDIEKRIKVEKHAADMFDANAISHSELREAFGKEAMALPGGEDTEETDLTEWNQTSWKLIEEPKALIQAVDEPYSPAAKAAAESAMTSITPENVAEAGEEETAAEIKKIKAKPKPKPPAKKRDMITDNFLSKMYQDLEETVLFNGEKKNFSMKYVTSLIETQAVEMSKKLLSASTSAFLRGYTTNTAKPLEYGKLVLVKKELDMRAQRYVNRLLRNVTSALNRQIDSGQASDKISLIRSVFSSMEYRVDLISDVEIRSAYNYGTVLALKARGFEQIVFVSDSDCQRCQEALNKPVQISSVSIEDLPPFHGDCNCELKPVNNEVAR